MQQNCRFEIISVNREENFLPCSTEWDKSVYFTPSKPPTEISCKDETLNPRAKIWNFFDATRKERAEKI